MSCSSSQKTIKNKCPEIFKNNFTEIIREKNKIITDKDTIYINEIRFECVFSSLYTHKVMYDKFGKWTKEIYLQNSKHPVLMWENVDLFSDGKKYIIFTNGLEEWKHIYASVMVFDLNENDLLAETSKEKELITVYFSELIKNQNLEKRDFYETYWKLVDLKHWQIMDRYK